MSNAHCERARFARALFARVRSRSRAASRYISGSSPRPPFTQRIHKLRLSPCVSNSRPPRERERDPLHTRPALSRFAAAKSLDDTDPCHICAYHTHRTHRSPGVHLQQCIQNDSVPDKRRLLQGSHQWRTHPHHLHAPSPWQEERLPQEHRSYYG